MNDPTPEELRRVAAWLDERSDTYDAGTKQVVRFLRGKAGETPAPRFRTVAERAPEPGTVVAHQDHGPVWVFRLRDGLVWTDAHGWCRSWEPSEYWRPVAGPFQVEGG